MLKKMYFLIFLCISFIIHMGIIYYPEKEVVKSGKLIKLEKNMKELQSELAKNHVYPLTKYFSEEDIYDLMNHFQYEISKEINKISKKRYFKYFIGINGVSKNFTIEYTSPKGNLEENNSIDCKKYFYGVGVSMEGILSKTYGSTIEKVMKQSPAEHILKLSTGDRFLGFEKNGKFYKNNNEGILKRGDQVLTFFRKNGVFKKRLVDIEKVCFE